MGRAPGFWTAAALVGAVVLGTARPVAAAEPRCGMPAGDAPAGATPLRADLTPVTVDNVITLGRSTEGSRMWDVEFTWTAECSLEPDDIKPVVGNLQGSDSSIDGKVLAPRAVVDGPARIVKVTLEVPRDPKKVPPGSFVGTLDVGSGAVGLGKAGLTIRHQEPLTVNRMSGLLQILWIVIGLLAALLLFGAQRIVQSEKVGDLADAATKGDRNSQDFTTPVAVIVGALALYPLIARLGGADVVPWPAWPVWLGVAGLLGGVVVGILKHRDSSDAVALVGGQRFATALLLSFGAGITAWRAAYLNSPDWALTIESALGLMGVVGGATATSALLFLSPNPKPPDPPAELKPEAAAALEDQAARASEPRDADENQDGRHVPPVPDDSTTDDGERRVPAPPPP